MTTDDPRPVPAGPYFNDGTPVFPEAVPAGDERDRPDAVAERRRLAGALANWALSPGESFRTLLPYLDLAYEEAYREGWMVFTNAINERLTRAEAGVSPSPGEDRLREAAQAFVDWYDGGVRWQTSRRQVDALRAALVFGEGEP